MMVAIVTPKQRDQLLWKEYTQGGFFVPTPDSDGNLIIGQEEIDQCINEEFLWVKDLPLIIYKKPISN
jgi:hypothetical protein